MMYLYERDIHMYIQIRYKNIKGIFHSDKKNTKERKKFNCGTSAVWPKINQTAQSKQFNETMFKNTNSHNLVEDFYL